MIDQITLTSNRSLLHSHVPAGVNLCNSNSCRVLTKDSMESFGLFETNAPNFNTYYPDVKAEDLKPSDDEFIFPIFRALSETMVRKYAPIDFTKAGVLKKSMNKLVGISIHTDHEQNSGNVLGAVKSATWQEAYKVGTLKIPAGANVKLAIDGKSHPQIARGIMMDPPSYNSVSVTVHFKWEWSHSVSDDQSPYSLWGTTMEDGSVFRKVVTDIVLYSEISIVPMGADPFAKLVRDGQMVNPKFTEDRQALQIKANELGAMDNTVMDFASIEQFSQFNKPPKTRDDMELSEFLKSLGLDAQANDEAIRNKITELTASKTLLDSLQEVDPEINKDTLTALKAVTPITEEQNTILSFVEENGGTQNLTDVVEFQKTALEAQRASAVNFYKLSNGDKAKEAIIESINNSNGATLKAFEEQFKEEYNTKVPLTCKSCGSHEVSRKASEATDPTPTPQTFREELAAKRAKKATEFIHGTEEN